MIPSNYVEPTFTPPPFTAGQRQKIIQWGAGLPFGLRVGFITEGFEQGPEFAIVCDRYGEAVYAIVPAETGGVTNFGTGAVQAVNYGSDETVEVRDVAAALAVIVGWERARLSKPLPVFVANDA